MTRPQGEGHGYSDTRNLVVGSRVDSGELGTGTVTFVGADRIGIAFDGGSEMLVHRENLEREARAQPASFAPPRTGLPWPASTFVSDDDVAEHFLGSHWDPFVDDASELLKRLPRMLQESEIQNGFASVHGVPRRDPADWVKGFTLVWPDATQGLAAASRIEPERTLLISLFPFFALGSQHTLTLREVRIWKSGVEAQVTADWARGEVTFFDTHFLINRAWYDTGKPYDFILAGLAYSAGPAQQRQWEIDRHPDEVAWLNQQRTPGEAPHEARYTLGLDGAAVLLPVDDWDVDDFSFHAPVKSVTEFKDWLGQDGWRVRATVMRMGDEDGDLDILITRRAWSGVAPPQVGQDIEGRLWLQGRLWTPLSKHG